MTSQEEQMLDSLVERVNSTKLTEKDTEAEDLLARGFANNPDAVYILAQSVLVQNIALEQARAQLTQAQEQVKQLQQQQQPAHSTSFLGSLLGHKDPPPPPPVPVQSGYQPVYSPQAPAYAPPPPPYQAGYAPPPPPYQGQPYGGAPQYVPPPSQGPSFLRGAAQTAAGVAAGALAFEGVESLLHGGFGHPGMGMGMGGFGMPGVGYGMGPQVIEERPVEEVVNNYYDSPGQGQEQRFDGGQGYGQDFDRGGEEHFRDSGNNDMQLQDASWDNSGSGSGGGFDENANFDSGDSGGGDFGGGNDDSGNF